jgi:hypothetical protein
MTVLQKDAWKQREVVISESFAALAERVRRRIPELVSRGTTSSNTVKYLDVVRTFALPGRADGQLVLGTMFTFFGGTLKVHCDLMQEDGPIVRDMGSLDFGADPAEADVDGAVASVVTFVRNVEDEIVSGLESQRFPTS